RPKAPPKKNRPVPEDPAVIHPRKDLLRDLYNVLCRGALLALDDVEFDSIAFGQALEALAGDGRVVHEAVLLTVFGGDESKALRVIEPLDRAGGACHVLLLRLVIGAGRAALPTT